MPYISVSKLTDTTAWPPTSSSPPRPAPSRWCRSPACRTSRLTATFRALRWHETGGDPVCPACGCCRLLRVPHPPAVQVQGLWQAVQRHQRHDLPRPQAADARLPDGHRDLRQRAPRASAPCSSAAIWTCSYKTAFVLAHKLREAMAADQAKYQPKGDVEIDGAYFGGTSASRRTTRPTGSTAAWPSTRPASAASWSSCASARAARCRSWSAQRTRACRCRPPGRARQHGLRRRGRVLGRAARPVRDQADQPQRRVLG